MSYLIEDETRLHVAPNGGLYRLQFLAEDSPSPPWENDGAVPMIWFSGHRWARGFNTEGARGYDLQNPFRYMNARKIRKHLADIAEFFGYGGAEGFDRDARDYFPKLPIAEARAALIEECRREQDASEKVLRFLADMWRAAGVPAEVIESRGYSQGDWAALLIVAHPEAVAAFGFDSMREYRKTCPDDLKTAAQEWGAWCWGGVIGYSVDRISAQEMDLAGLTREDLDAGALNGLTYCEHVDSCWGFYPEGTQHYWPLETAHAYAIGEAVAVADHDDSERAKVAA